MTFPATDANGATVQLLTASELTTLLAAAASTTLPTGAATQTTLAAVLTALGTPAQAGGGVDTVVKATSTNKSATVGTSASVLMAANTSRRGFAIQNQSATASVYISGLATATADNQSLMIAPGALYETTSYHIGTGAISIISSAASTPVYAREF